MTLLLRLDYVLLHSLVASLLRTVQLTEVIKCGRPGYSSLCRLSHRPDVDGYSVGAVVNYTMLDASVYSTDPLERKCLPNGVWSGKMPSCFSKIESNLFWKEYVKNISKIKNEIIDGDTNTCIGVSQIGLYFELKKLLLFESITFSWNQTVPPKVFLVRENVSMQCDHSPVEIFYSSRVSTLLFKCPTEFISEKIYIRTESRYFGLCGIEVKAKVGAGCLVPDVPYNHRVGSKTVDYPSTYKIECKDDYLTIGENNLSCNFDGTWDPQSPTCERQVVDCHRVPEVSNGHYDFNSTKEGSRARLRCNEGYMPLTEDDVIHCLPTGDWGPPNLNCKLIECDPKPRIPNGKGKALHYPTYFGSKLHIVCDKGYAATNGNPRECLSNGTWGHIDICEEITCNSESLKHPSYGKWLSFNNTNYIKVLVCDEGYLIEGFPAISVCQMDGLWSYTTAICIKTPMNDEWLRSLSPTTILMIAVAVGAGTAILVLCLAICVSKVKKWRHPMKKSSVFHVDTLESSVYRDSKEDIFFKPNTYEDVIELRTSTVLRKPIAALPHIPIDTDPVYAQPFEAASSEAKSKAKNNLDIYTAHIYAEPVDSQIPDSLPTAKDSWLKNGGRKISLPGHSQTRDLEEMPKSCSSNRSSTSDTFKELKILSPKRTLSGLINNSIYLDLKDQCLSSIDNLEKLNMINNEIYRENFSHA